ncbi:MAG TPA: hypothetical protein VFS43_12965 [Polyangiaceae bacterium]|nr:hypothetical protein [Polyangiaceae bacterium]
MSWSRRLMTERATSDHSSNHWRCSIMAARTRRSNSARALGPLMPANDLAFSTRARSLSRWASPRPRAASVASAAWSASRVASRSGARSSASSRSSSVATPITDSTPVLAVRSRITNACCSGCRWRSAALTMRRPSSSHASTSAMACCTSASSA